MRGFNQLSEASTFWGEAQFGEASDVVFPVRRTTACVTTASICRAPKY